jgi:hypothetical protein
MESVMTIDTSGRWWTGTEFSDVAEYLRALTAAGHPVSEVTQSKCRCGGTVFSLLRDDEEGCAQRVCRACGERAFIADSAEAWDEAQPTVAVCPCGGEHSEIGVGFSMRTDGEIEWVTVGQRCIRCGVLGSSVDWKIDYAPSGHLRTQA